MDFIFNVDLSTIYIILRRDFATPQDKNGSLTSPLADGFHYSATAANEAARAHCIKEASKGPSLTSSRAVHFDRDGLYIGGCVTLEQDRDRFEVWVKKLRARGSWSKGNAGVVVGESRGSCLPERSGTPTSWRSRCRVERIGRLWSRLKYGT